MLHAPDATSSTSLWRISSESGAWIRGLLVFLVLLAAETATAAEHLTQTEALALVFPGAKLERKEHFLTEEQRQKIQDLAKVEMKSRYVVSYEARQGTELLGVAFFDTHVVRTQQETAMIAISPKGTILRVEVIRFQEPEEYAAPQRWKDQLKGQSLSPKLSLKADIRPLSGASLTAQALVDASRRALAEFEVLGPKAPP
jgi:Na+-translocating ferredoxin:NAD+ oxidoreductase RnfG subunit